MYRDDCLPAYRDQHATSFGEAGRAKLAELRAEGRDPTQSREARKQRGIKNSQRMQEQKVWEAEHGTDADPDMFKREILPRLQGLPLRVLAKATGLSQQYCSSIRRGKNLPHQRHWKALAECGKE